MFYRRSKIMARGQTIVLAAMMVLFLAFVVFSTLGIAWKTKERVRLQVASDASAYSEAVKTARAFNYFAYTNRSIASHLVSMTVAHAYQTEISGAIGLYVNLAIVWVLLASDELNTCHGWKCLAVWRKALHFAQDLAVAFDLALDAGDFNEDIRELDKRFVQVIQGYAQSIRLMRTSQTGVKYELTGENVAGVVSELGLNLGSVIENIDSKMLSYNAPAGQMNDLGTALFNIDNLKRVFAESDNNDAKIDMTDVANSARPLWARNRALTGNTVMFIPLMARIRNQTRGVCTILQLPFMQGISGIYDRQPPSLLGNFLLRPPKARSAGKGIYSMDAWNIPLCVCRHSHAARPAFPQPFPFGQLAASEIYSSDQSSSAHAPGQPGNVGSVKYIMSIVSRILSGSAHGDEKHDLDMDKVLSFERFNIKKDGNYHQPAVYKAISQNLSLNERGGPQPWDVFDAGKFEGHIFGKETHDASVQMSAPKEATSLSKALVYYHHPGHWQEPPNFWNPFWRAKLHPWARNEFLQLSTVNGGGFEGTVMQKAFSESATAVMNGGF